MARNEEKANNMLNLFLRRHEVGKEPVKRPTAINRVETAQECLKWRKQVINEISNEIQLIQNASMGEFKIREKNDYINTLLYEKSKWESRIITLAGLDFADAHGISTIKERQHRYEIEKRQERDKARLLQPQKKNKNDNYDKQRERDRQYEEYRKNADATKIINSYTSEGITDIDGRGALGVDGYYYFGAAKELPGVMELYTQHQTQSHKKLKRSEIINKIDSSYYGFQESDNQALLREELMWEKKVIEQLKQQDKISQDNLLNQNTDITTDK